jgi:hypothetical protein
VVAAYAAKQEELVMKLRIAVPGGNVVDIDDASPEEAAAFIAALGKEGGQSATPPALTAPAPAAASSSSASAGPPEWFLALSGRDRIVCEVLARVWAMTSTGHGVGVPELRETCKWLPVQYTISDLMEQLAKSLNCARFHHPRRTVLLKRSAAGSIGAKLYGGERLVDAVRMISGKTTTEVLEAVTST